MFKVNLAISTSVFLFISSAADLFAMEPLHDLDDKPGNQLFIARTEDAEPGPINHLPKDVMQVILIETSKDANPRRLTSVCKAWRVVLGLNENPYGKLHYSITSPLHSTMNTFMQKCMDIYRENQYYHGILRYTPVEGGQVVTLKFLDFKDGTFDLSTCGNTGQSLVITESIDRFFKVGKANKDKKVILIALRHLFEQEINTLPDQKFASHITAWDADKAPVGMFWRHGNDENLARVDYLTTAGMSEISSRNLYENWMNGKWAVRPRTGSRSGVGQDGGIFMSIFEPK
ncbi:MAG: hypothetical protein H0X26_09865 [Alphaproteobacteria bacterium]|nr:hypothetical protein [Alphaproteobacteria bacterium]